jgi:chloroplastic oxoene reductase
VVDITPNIFTTNIFTSFIKKVTFAKKKSVPLFVIPKEGELEFLVNLAEEDKFKKTLIDSKHPLSEAEMHGLRA